MTEWLAFWDIVGEDGTPWGMIATVVGIIGLAVVLCYADNRREETALPFQTRWWIGPLLLLIGIIALMRLFVGDLRGEVDRIWTYLASSEGIAVRVLLVCSLLLIRIEGWYSSRRLSAAEVPPVWPLTILLVCVLGTLVFAKYYPWPWNEHVSTGKETGLWHALVIMVPMWVLQVGLGLVAIGWMLRSMFSHGREVGSWLSGTMKRRPLTAGIVLSWCAGIWYLLHD